MSWQLVGGVVWGFLVLWLGLVLALWLAKPDATRLTESLRLLPDVLRLLPRIARDPTLPRIVRVQLWCLLGYLALPLDLIPDFIPVIGYADDAIIVALVLRSVVRHSGLVAVQRHWPGTADGLAALVRLTRLGS